MFQICLTIKLKATSSWITKSWFNEIDASKSKFWTSKMDLNINFETENLIRSTTKSTELKELGKISRPSILGNEVTRNLAFSVAYAKNLSCLKKFSEILLFFLSKHKHVNPFLIMHQSSLENCSTIYMMTKIYIMNIYRPPPVPCKSALLYIWTLVNRICMPFIIGIPFRIKMIYYNWKSDGNPIYQKNNDNPF